MRGPAGDRRSVDWLVIDTTLVWASDDTDDESPFGFWYDPRPELSNMGRFVSNDAKLALTDSVGLVGTWLYDTEGGETSRASAGVLIDHGFGYSSYVDYRYLDEPGAEIVALGTRYELTRKYALDVFGIYDIDRDAGQSLGARIERRFPQWTLYVGVDLDDISDRTAFSVSVRPVGMGGQDRSRVFTRDEVSGAVRSAPAGPTASRMSGGPFGP
jgi:hypothetical protein